MTIGKVLVAGVKRALGAVEALTYWLLLRVQAQRNVSVSAHGGRCASPCIVLDGLIFQWASRGTGLGVARVWDRLMSEWSASGFANRVVVLDRGGTAPRYPGFEYRRIPTLRTLHSASQRLMIEELCHHERADLFVSTYHTHPLRCRSLLYLHDMTPEVLGWDLRKSTWREKRSAIRHASCYICVSANTARDFRRLFPEETGKPVVVVPPGLDPVFHPSQNEDIRSLVETLDLPRHYFLFTGPRRGYKNAALIFRAAAEFQNRPDLAILCVGGALNLEPEFADLAGTLTVRVARLTDDEMRAAYSGATALLYVSKYEGFGLPILEAMACGCPVITCDNSSQREVAGEAAIYVGDADSDALAEAMRGVLASGLRAELVRRGFARSAASRSSEKADAVARALLSCTSAAER